MTPAEAADWPELNEESWKRVDQIARDVLGIEERCAVGGVSHARALLALAAENQRMRKVCDASLALRAAELEAPLGDSVSEMTRAAQAAQAKTQRALTEWRTTIDAIRPEAP